MCAFVHAVYTTTPPDFTVSSAVKMENTYLTVVCAISLITVEITAAMQKEVVGNYYSYKLCDRNYFI